MVREGIVDEHDKPYFYHGDKGNTEDFQSLVIRSYWLWFLLELAKIAEEYEFRLPLTFAGAAEEEGKEKAKDFKTESQKMAIAGFGKVPSM